LILITIINELDERLDLSSINGKNDLFISMLATSKLVENRSCIAKIRSKINKYEQRLYLHLIRGLNGGGWHRELQAAEY